MNTHTDKNESTTNKGKDSAAYPPKSESAAGGKDIKAKSDGEREPQKATDKPVDRNAKSEVQGESHKADKASEKTEPHQRAPEADKAGTHKDRPRS
jgi:hypothetical protein